MRARAFVSAWTGSTGPSGNPSKARSSGGQGPGGSFNHWRSSAVFMGAERDGGSGRLLLHHADRDADAHFQHQFAIGELVRRFGRPVNEVC